MQNLDQKKTCKENDIPVKIIKSHKDIFSYFIHHNFNNSVYSSIFPSKTDIILIHKRKSRFNIESYRPVSILPVLSKIFERWMFDQMYSSFNQILSKHQCGFWQGHSTQHSLLLMVEKLKKLAAYGFDQPSLSVIFSYFSVVWGLGGDQAKNHKINKLNFLNH